ncbi:MAG: alcohol dehydrogenase catalytic domain-containing protein, partial [Firmicutes bacterium]|nr:alcohol dehydrogenase catalytic domain-containing protein [Bacillota bacterium]
MKSAVYYDLGDFGTEERDIPEIGPGEVLVQVKTCGVCGTDIHKAVTKSVPTPIVLGHELAGVIVKTGPGVDGFQGGDRVYVAHHVPCFTCHHCRRGHHTLCKQFKETNIDPGGFSEYIRVPVENTRHSMGLIPDDMPFEVAALVEPVACCVRGVNRLDLHTGDSVLIMGAGSIGLIHAQIVKARGAG